MCFKHVFTFQLCWTDLEDHFSATKDHPDNSSKVNPTKVLKRQAEWCRCVGSGL